MHTIYDSKAIKSSKLHKIIQINNDDELYAATILAKEDMCDQIVAGILEDREFFSTRVGNIDGLKTVEIFSDIVVMTANAYRQLKTDSYIEGMRAVNNFTEHLCK